MLGESKDIEWKVLWPGGWGAHDRYHSARKNKDVEQAAQRRARTCPHGKVGPCPQCICELLKPWGSPGSDKGQNYIRHGFYFINGGGGSIREFGYNSYAYDDDRRIES